MGIKYYVMDSKFHAFAMDLAQFKQYIGKQEKEYKNAVLKYMEQRPDPAYTTNQAYDQFTGENIGQSDNCYCDGLYYWFESDIYNLKKYNVMLRDEFVQYVLDKERGVGK